LEDLGGSVDVLQGFGRLVRRQRLGGLVERLVRQRHGGKASLGQARLLEGASKGSPDDRSHEKGYDRSHHDPGPEGAAGNPDRQGCGTDLGAAAGRQGGPRQGRP
jgi:hypothetical protein